MLDDSRAPPLLGNAGVEPRPNLSFGQDPEEDLLLLFSTRRYIGALPGFDLIGGVGVENM
jgi:hypothetical protein